MVAEEEGGLYQAERQLMVDMLEALVAKQGKGNKLRAEMLEGEWELVRGFGGECVYGWMDPSYPNLPYSQSSGVILMTNFPP